MAKREQRSSKPGSESAAHDGAQVAVTPSSGNVFEDVGFADAEERQAKVQLAVAINRILDQRAESQVEAARILAINQPKISALRNYRLQGFSLERLMHFLTALDQDIEIVIRTKPRTPRPARITIKTAA